MKRLKGYEEICIDLFSKVDVLAVAAGDVDPVSTGKIAQHDFTTRSTVSIVAVSAPLRISVSAPAMRTVTAIFPKRSLCGCDLCKLETSC